jgi:hypothetical protein
MTISGDRREDEHDGGCLCGAVRYKLRGALKYAGHCHCRSCQKAIGAGFVTWAGVKKENFEVIEGRLKVCETSPGVERGFCDACGTSLTYVAEEGWPGLVSVTAATLDDPAFAEPTVHVYVAHRQPWVKLDDGLPTFERF